MVGGRGLSGRARRSIEVYLDGRMAGVGVVLGKYGGIGGGGPGKVLRFFLVSGFPVFLFPLLLYLFHWVYLWFQSSHEVCTLALGVVRVGCKEVLPEVRYGLSQALHRAYWLLFFTLFEGSEVLPGAVFVRSVVMFTLGFLTWFVFPEVGSVFLFSSLAMLIWCNAKTVHSVFRWTVFLLVIAGFGPVWILIEVFTLFDVGKVGAVQVSESPVVSLVPHKFLSLSVPPDSCSVSENYFLRRAQGDGMTEKQRSVALVGDRFLKLLASHWVESRDLTVSAVGRHESCQTDEALLGWTASVVGSVEGGKKTRASFAEVL